MLGCIAIVVGSRTSSNWRRLTECGDIDDGDYDDPVLRRGARPLGLERLTAGSLCAFFLIIRSFILRGEYH